MTLTNPATWYMCVSCRRGRKKDERGKDRGERKGDRGERRREEGWETEGREEG